MKDYACSIIDMYFLNKDTGFVTGMGKKPLRSAIILYTTNGGQSWTTVFENHIQEEYCWKIQRLTKMVWFASIEDFAAVPPRVLRSNDGGMTWKVQIVSQTPYNIEGIGFINPMLGWTGGGPNKSFETKNGGRTWDSVAICPYMNRVFRVNDTTIIATGNQIWKYKGKGTYPAIPADRYAWMKAYPNPVKDNLLLDVSVAMNTRVLISVHEQSGKRLAVIENADKARGSYQYNYNTSRLAPGMYYVTLKTHEDKGTIQIIVSR